MQHRLRHALAVLLIWMPTATSASAADIPVQSFDMTAPSPGELRTEALLPGLKTHKPVEDAADKEAE